MSKCLNPECLAENELSDKMCQKCGNKLLLKERYRAVKIIGQGGFGRTFLAIDEDKPSKSYCVIKQFLLQAQGTDNLEKASELFAQEAHRLDELGKHSQIPELLAYFIQDNRQYLIQQFIEGQNLKQELNSQGNFNEQKIKALLINILNVLKFVHQNNIIHRDIKPENIIRRREDNNLFLVDFGASKVVENSRLSITATVIGSAQYCPPEQSFGKPQYCSDLYSLGVTCLHLLTGIEPFNLFDMGEGNWVWRDYLNNNFVSNDLGNILDKLVEFAYKKRYQSVDEVFNILLLKKESVLDKIPIHKTIENKVNNTINTNKDTLKSGEFLSVNEFLISANGNYSLVLQADGNLVLYNCRSSKAIWASGTNGRKPISAVMQEDGNFVIYFDGFNPWASNTANRLISHLKLEDNGTVILYNNHYSLTIIS
ncbi:high-affnity carbon uptake protein Hat/HatR [Geminocystis sp. NIES-3708]|uniref:protein kinase domain-containing protein n=1 Tax=Geminocystis sp. NIES-3708 TaxID=1615909 RepID=UPI0005FC7B84|nr:protein kinase [Geminocystis sp. NIES-3708]BAQ61112.1 high-affnity carbon uptake protein Hat/HatR [Geminocystis sp. NIES-3708]